MYPYIIQSDESTEESDTGAYKSSKALRTVDTNV